MTCVGSEVKDPYYDYEADERERTREENKRKQKAKQSNQPLLIVSCFNFKHQVI